MPRAEGLFRRAMAQSGAGHHVLPTQTASRIGGYLAQRLGVPPARDAVAAVPVERLLAAQAELKAELLAHPDPGRWGAEGGGQLDALPACDRREVIPAAPIERIAAGASADDWRLPRVITGEIDQIPDQMLTGPVGVHGYRALAAYGLPVGTALAAYQAPVSWRKPRGPARCSDDRLVDAYPRHPPS